MQQLRKILLALFLAAALHAQEPPVLSVCEVLDHRLQYNDTNVIVLSRPSATMEGVWLSEKCGGKLVTPQNEWDYNIWFTHSGPQTAPPPELPQDFRWDRQKLIAELPRGTAVAQLRDDPNCRCKDHWVAAFGRFETKQTFPSRRYASGEVQIFGFGHKGGSPAQLVSPTDGRFCLAPADANCNSPGEDLSRLLWTAVKAELIGPGGLDYFEQVMKDAALPSLKGTVVASTSSQFPNLITIAISDAMNPELTLRLTSPYPKPIPPGTTVEFEGIAREFTRDPFMVTFDVDAEKLRITSAK